MSDSIFMRYGGFAAVSRIVADFYDRVLSSDVLAPYFAQTDMATQIDHQTKFFASMMGGPASYSDEHLEAVHARLHITDDAFAELALILQETLEDHDFDDTDVGTVVGEVTRRKRLVVEH